MSMVSGVRCQVSEKDDRLRILIILNLISFLALTPDTRHLPVLHSPKGVGGKPVWLKEKIDRLTPYSLNYF